MYKKMIDSVTRSNILKLKEVNALLLDAKRNLELMKFEQLANEHGQLASEIYNRLQQSGIKVSLSAQIHSLRKGYGTIEGIPFWRNGDCIIALIRFIEWQLTIKLLCKRFLDAYNRFVFGIETLKSKIYPAWISVH